jgi:hypothetical protein
MHDGHETMKNFLVHLSRTMHENEIEEIPNIVHDLKSFNK